jgi:hypothetical protein
VIKAIEDFKGVVLRELQQQAERSQQQSQLLQVLLLSQFQPAASTASTKDLATYRERALNHYNLAGDQNQSYCMVTGDQVVTDQLTAGHIYRQAWPAPILVSLWSSCLLCAATHDSFGCPLPGPTVCASPHVLAVLHVSGLLQLMGATCIHFLPFACWELLASPPCPCRYMLPYD